MVFFFQAEDGIRDLTVTGVQTCALPISISHLIDGDPKTVTGGAFSPGHWFQIDLGAPTLLAGARLTWDVSNPDRKSTRLNSSHSQISYAVFCLKKKN